jgi:hypothetical protein
MEHDQRLLEKAPFYHGGFRLSGARSARVDASRPARNAFAFETFASAQDIEFSTRTSNVSRPRARRSVEGCQAISCRGWLFLMSAIRTECVWPCALHEM